MRESKSSIKGRRSDHPYLEMAMKPFAIFLFAALAAPQLYSQGTGPLTATIKRPALFSTGADRYEECFETCAARGSTVSTLLALRPIRRIGL